MDNAKIQFSADELRLVADKQFILTKNRIIEKISIFFGLLLNRYRIASADIFSSLGIVQQPKISRGENYNGLPYVILDYPKQFTKGDIFAVRTMFLWGNDFCITLHLKGRYKTVFEKSLIKNAPSIMHSGWYLQSSGNEWQHHHTPDTHFPANVFTACELSSVVAGADFIKIAFYFSLQQWEEAEQLFSGCFHSIITLLDLKA